MAPEVLQEITGALPPSLYGRTIDYWTALALFIDEGLLTSSRKDKAWLKSVFGERNEMEEMELRARLETRGERVSKAS